MPSAFKKSKIDNKIIVSGAIDYYFGLLGQFIQNSTRQRNPYNGYTCRRSKFEVWWFIFIDHLENPFIPAQFNAIRNIKKARMDKILICSE